MKLIHGDCLEVIREENRDFIGIELNEDYLRIAEGRIANAQPGLPGI